MKNLIKSKIFWFIIVFVSTIPAFFALVKPGYYNMHDDMQLIRQLEMEKCLKDGQIPCRWTPDLGYGYGYPLFNFYPPMPYFVGEVFKNIGFSYLWTVKLTAVCQIILSGMFMFILASSLAGNFGGLIASVFYTYAPYHAVNIYVRGAMNEAWAAVFFPLIFHFSRLLIIKNKKIYIVGLSLSFAGLLLSHNPMALTFSPILLIWCIYWLFVKYKKNILFTLKSQLPVITKLIVSAVLSLSLAAFFTLPLLTETKFVQIESMFNNYYHFSVHFVTLFQLFISNFWGDGPSVWGPDDGMSFMIGYLHWIVSLLIIFFSAINFFKTRKINKKTILPLLIALMGLGTVFMTHNKSTFIWLLLTPIQKVQFPWRFLNLTAFLFSLSSAFFLNLFFQKLKNKIFIPSLLLIALVISLNVNYFHPLKSGPITDEQKFSGLAWTNQITSGIYDYLPKTARIAAQAPAKEYIDEIKPSESLNKIYGQKKGTDWMFFNLSLKNNSQVIISQLAFPNFQILDNNEKIDYKIEPELGRIVLNLSSGEHQIYIKFINTPIRTISNIISLIAWVSVLFYLITPLWMKLRSKK